MRKTIRSLCAIIAVLWICTGFSAGLRISGLPAEFTCKTGEKAEISFSLDNTEGNDLADTVLILEEVLSGDETDEVIGTLSFTSFNGKKPEEETDCLEMELISGGTSIPISATYYLPVLPDASVSVRVTLYDSEFNVIDSSATRCTIPETANKETLNVCGIPVFIIITVLAVLNVTVWGTVLFRALIRKKHALSK